MLIILINFPSIQRDFPFDALPFMPSGSAPTHNPLIADFKEKGTPTSVDQYEHRPAHSFSSLGRGSDVYPLKTIDHTGPRDRGLRTHDLPSGFCCTKSRNNHSPR